MIVYSTRLLKPSEVYRLAGTEAEPLIPYLRDNDTALILVVEKDDKIVGNWLLINTWHAECVWIHPNERGNPVIAGRLINGMKQMASAAGIEKIVTSALTEEIEKLIINHLKGEELPGKHFVFPVENK